MKYLCENIQGCVFGYTQSDEITLILVDYKKLTSSAWFDYEVQKMCSIAASMATMKFNQVFKELSSVTLILLSGLFPFISILALLPGVRLGKLFIAPVSFHKSIASLSFILLDCNSRNYRIY